MRTTLYYLVQFILIVAVGYLAYLPTLKIDFFTWENNKNDGLYLLVVPIILLPLLIIFSGLKYLIVRKANIPTLFKWTFTITIFVGLLNTLIVSVSASNGGLFVVTAISLALCIFLVFEMIMVKRNAHS